MKSAIELIRNTKECDEVINSLQGEIYGEDFKLRKAEARLEKLIARREYIEMDLRALEVEIGASETCTNLGLACEMFERKKILDRGKKVHREIELENIPIDKLIIMECNIHVLEFYVASLSKQLAHIKLRKRKLKKLPAFPEK